MTDDVAESARERPTDLANALEDRLRPREEVGEHGFGHTLTSIVPLLRRERGPVLLELEECTDSKERFSCVLGLEGDGGFPEPPPRVRPATDLVRRFLAFAHRISAVKRVVDAMGVGLDIPLEALEHRADGVARVLRLVFEEDVVLVGEHDEEMSLRARLPFAIRDPCRLNRNARGVRRKTERIRLCVLYADFDNRSERGADVLGISTHETIVDLDARRRELLCEAVKRHSPAEFLRENVRDERRGEDASLVDLARVRRRHELRRRAVHRSLLVYRACLYDPNRAAALISKLAAFFEVDPLCDAFERRIQNLDADLGDIEVAKIAPAFRLRARGPTRAAIFVAHCQLLAFGRLAELFGELCEASVRFCELELELLCIDSFGLRQENPPSEQFHLRLQQLVGAPKLVPLLHDRSKLCGRVAEDVRRLCQRLVRGRQRRLERGDPLAEHLLDLAG